MYFLSSSLVSNNLTNYGRRHFKLYHQLSCFAGHPVFPDCIYKLFVLCDLLVSEVNTQLLKGTVPLINYR